MVHDAEYGGNHGRLSFAFIGVKFFAGHGIFQNQAIVGRSEIGRACACQNGYISGSVDGGTIEVLDGRTDVVGTVCRTVILFIAEQSCAAVHGVGAVMAGGICAVVFGNFQGGVQDVDCRLCAVVSGDHSPTAGFHGGIDQVVGAVFAQNIGCTNASVDTQDPRRGDHVSLCCCGSISFICFGQRVGALGQDVGVDHECIGKCINDHSVTAKAVGGDVRIFQCHRGVGAFCTGCYKYNAGAGEVVGVLAVGFIGEDKGGILYNCCRIGFAAVHIQVCCIGRTKIIERVAEFRCYVDIRNGNNAVYYFCLVCQSAGHFFACCVNADI